MSKYDFTKQSKRIIAERDNFICIRCSTQYRLSYAHFIPRSKGGLGIPENGVLLCYDCHHALDNGHDSDLANEIHEYIKEYLTIHYGGIMTEKIIYNKWKGFEIE